MNAESNYEKKVIDHWRFDKKRKLVKLECQHVIGPVLNTSRMRKMWCFTCEREHSAWWRMTREKLEKAKAEGRDPSRA